eukprot:6171915-Pleurochrysis_carterae.AAC.1
MKWNLKAAKKDALSVEAAHKFLNEELLCTVESSTLEECKIIITPCFNVHNLAVAAVVQHLWKQDKEAVVDGRNLYVKRMNDLMLRQPLWLQIKLNRFLSLQAKFKLPASGSTFLMQHPYNNNACQEESVEVHVDLAENAFDEKRSAHPLGGNFSVRSSRPQAKTITVCSTGTAA